MCGRFKIYRSEKAAIAKAYGIREEDVPDYVDELDCRPGSFQGVVEVEAGERKITEMKWGFKLPDRLLFNTKSETVLESNFWKPRIENRCIVPASGFFEWQKINGKTGPKFEITVPNTTFFGFAGIWGNWKNPKSKEWEKTFSIFTTIPNSKMAPFHDRQPVILSPNEYEEWLTPSERAPVHLLRILPEERMNIAPVGISLVPDAPSIGGLFDY